VVAFKPVGMRTIGSFSAQTLEMVVSAQTREPFKAVSKLDMGCAGLCVLRRDGVAVKEVSHVFTASRFYCFASYTCMFLIAGIVSHFPF
jgi:hypothetical protein